MTSKEVLVGLLAILTIVVARRPFTIKISDISCIRYAEPVSQFECHLETIKNKTVVNAFMIFSKEVKSFQVKVISDLIRLAGPPVKMFDLTLDGCKTLEALELNSVLKVMLAHVRKSGHMPKRCPLRANENFTATRYAIDADILPLYTPDFSYSADISTLIGSKVVAKLLSKGSVETKNKAIFRF